MRAAGVKRSSDYLSLLDSLGGEWNALIDEITIGETFFFRYPSQWVALRDRIIPDCTARAGREPLRVCAGCANGAEPYTLSMMAGKNAGLSIVGMDISDSRIGAGGRRKRAQETCAAICGRRSPCAEERRGRRERRVDWRRLPSR